MIFGAVALISVMLVTEEEQKTSLDAAAQLTMMKAASHCVDVAALRFARYTNETAAQVADYAAQSCAKEFSIYPESAMNNAARSAVVRLTALKVMEWRAKAGAVGPAAYDDIQRELEANREPN